MQAKDILDHQPEVIFLDVRTPEEIADGHIPGAAMADVKASNFEEEIKQLDPNKEYVVYCSSLLCMTIWSHMIYLADL